MSLKIFKALSRRKTDTDDCKSEMARCLNLLDLTALGVGATLGLGVYVLAGSVAKTVAGPAVCLSFLAAAVASAFAGLCYAEFAARVPKAGSAYVYSYVTVGEFIAFMIGWNLILEYTIGTASVARGLSNYVDALADNKIRTAFNSSMPINVSFLSPYPDFLSFGMVLVLTMLLAFGVKESTVLNNIFTFINLATVVTVIVSGSIKADINNWKLNVSDIEGNYGTGGFMPYGLSGVVAGAAKCFYGFVGFDGIATTGEEAKNPQKDIPLAIVISLVIIFGAYFGISTVLTMMLPYYEQNADAPFPYAFEQVGWTTLKWIVTSAAVFALCTSMLGAMFPLPRVIYAMANDGIVFKPLGKVNKWTQTPAIATILSGIFTGFMAMIFDLDQLIDMMSIGTLLAYTIVAASVLVIRYTPDASKTIKNLDKDANQYYQPTLYSAFVEIFNLHNNKEPNYRTSRIANWSTVIFSVFSGLFAAIAINVPQIVFTEPFYFVGFVISLAAMLILIVVVARQPVDNVKLSFRVPLVPFIPCLSIFCNLYLMMALDLHTWIRFVVWMLVGFLIYFLYGIKNSVEGEKMKTQDQQLTENVKYSEKNEPLGHGSYSVNNPE